MKAAKDMVNSIPADKNAHRLGQGTVKMLEFIRDLEQMGIDL